MSRCVARSLPSCSVRGTLRRDARRASLILRRQCLFRLHYRVSWVGLDLYA